MKTVELKMSRPETVKGFWPAPVVQKVLISGWGNLNFTTSVSSPPSPQKMPTRTNNINCVSQYITEIVPSPHKKKKILIIQHL